MVLSNPMDIPRIAIIHDWLTGMRGGEKCLEVFCELFPEASLMTLLHKKGSVSAVIENMEIRTSFLQHIPGIFKDYRNYLPLFPGAIESFDLSGFDIILSSSHCAAKGARIPAGSLHICYCYTPMRYAWRFFDEYFSSEHPIKRKLIAFFMNRLKRWDILTNKKVDYFIAISHNVKDRINRYYSRDADVIYPPVDIGRYGGGCGENRAVRSGYYLIVSALVPYKMVDLAVRAFNANGKDLLVVGSGSEEARLKKMSGNNIMYTGWVDDRDLGEYYSNCRALIFPGEEDFGIVPVEAQMYGKPVIAYARGGVLETVNPLGGPPRSGSGCTGVYFREQTPVSLNEAIEEFEKNETSFVPGALKDNASRFNRDRFKTEIKLYIDDKWKNRDENTK